MKLLLLFPLILFLSCHSGVKKEQQACWDSLAMYHAVTRDTDYFVEDSIPNTGNPSFSITGTTEYGIIDNSGHVLYSHIYIPLDPIINHSEITAKTLNSK